MSPDESAKLAVDGAVIADNAVCVEASYEPGNIPTVDWLQIQWLHIQGDENGLLRFVSEMHQRAYADGANTPTPIPRPARATTPQEGR